MFLEELKRKLKENNVLDIEEIIEEYEYHFDYKMNDGYSEEEISKKLGNPTYLADQYIGDVKTTKNKNRIASVIGLFFLDLFILQFFILFFAWVISIFAFSISNFAAGSSFILGISPFGLIPETPYWCGAVLGVSLISMGVLIMGLTYYSFLYMKQLMRSYFRFHKNVISYAKDRPLLPSLQSHPMMTKKQTRILRSVLLMSLNAFAISFVLGYIVCSITAKSLEFWHVFGWFV